MTETFKCLQMLLLCVVVPSSAARTEAPAERFILSVVSDSKPGREEAFRIWYDSVHIPEVLQNLPEIKSAQRFVLTDSATREIAGRYLTIYEIETVDLAAFRRTVATVSKRFDHGDALDTATMRWTYHRQLTPRTTLGNIAAAKGQ